MGARPTNTPFYPATQSLEPNPDWWSAILFKRLVGRGVLRAALLPTVTSSSSSPSTSSGDALQAFAFCSRASGRLPLLLLLRRRCHHHALCSLQ